MGLGKSAGVGEEAREGLGEEEGRKWGKERVGLGSRILMDLGRRERKGGARGRKEVGEEKDWIGK